MRTVTAADPAAYGGGDDTGAMTQAAPVRSGAGRLAHRVQDGLDRLIGGVATIALIALIAIIFANVIGRYGFNTAITWAAEAAKWLFILVIFLAVPLAHRSRRHLSIDLLVDRLPAPLRTAAAFLSDLVIAYTTVMLLFGGYRLLLRVGGVNYILDLPSWLKFAVVPVSCGLGLLVIALRGLEEHDVAAGSPARDWAVWRGPVAIAAAALLYLVVNRLGWIAVPGADPTTAMALAFAAAMALGVPVTYAILFAAFVATLAGGLLPPAAVVQTMVNGASKFLLLAIPFFITAGALMNAGGLTTRLMDMAFSLVGHVRGGFAQVNIVSSGLYAGISGSSYSEAALGSKLLVPQMIRHGYEPGFACAVTAAGATLPNVIPPSIALLILAAVANLSVGALWLAGVGPGLVMAACLMLCVHVIARRRGHGTAVPRASLARRGAAVAGALPVLALALLVLGGIRFGIVTPTEAGVLAVVYGWLLGMLVYRAYDWRGLWTTLRAAAVDAALVGLLIGTAAPFAFVLVTEQVPQTVAAAVTGLSDNPVIVLLLANIVMLLFGMVLDIGAAILILTPLLMPVVTQLGVDPVHFGLVIVVNLMLGGLTPPVGMLAFITSTVSGTPVAAVFRAMLPLLLSLFAALAIITYVPAVSLGLGWLVGGR